MTLTQVWRIDDLILCSIALVMFAVQMWSIRRELDGPRAVLCAMVVYSLLRDIEGLTENLIQANPGGVRLLLSAIYYLGIIVAVLWRKVLRDLDHP